MVHSYVAKWSLNKGQNTLCLSSLSQQTITHLDRFMTQRVYHDMIDLIMGSYYSLDWNTGLKYFWLLTHVMVSLIDSYR